MAVFFLVLSFLFSEYVAVKVRGSLVNEISFAFGPYILIIFVNNFIASRYGFVMVVDQVVYLTICGMLFFLIGVSAFWSFFSRLRVKHNIQKSILEPNYLMIKRFIFGVSVARCAELSINILKVGITNIHINDYEALLSKGVFAHLIIISVPLSIILFMEAVDTNDKSLFFILGLFLFVNFMSLIKYHVISLIVFFAIYLVISKRGLFLSSVKIVILVVLLFSFNYYFAFYFRSDYMPPLGYYIHHLWLYIAGGVINTNLMIENYNYSMLNYFGEIFFSIPNLFRKALSMNNINMRAGLSFLDLYPKVSYGKYYGGTNVISTLGLTYGKEKILSLFICNLLGGIISGFFFSKIVDRNTNKFQKTIGIIYVGYLFLSFFGFYFSVVRVQETFMWAIFIVPFVFKLKKKGN